MEQVMLVFWVPNQSIVTYYIWWLFDYFYNFLKIYNFIIFVNQTVLKEQSHSIRIFNLYSKAENIQLHFIIIIIFIILLFTREKLFNTHAYILFPSSSFVFYSLE